MPNRKYKIVIDQTNQVFTFLSFNDAMDMFRQLPFDAVLYRMDITNGHEEINLSPLRTLTIDENDIPHIEKVDQ